MSLAPPASVASPLQTTRGMSAPTDLTSGRCAEVRGPDELTQATAPAVAQAVAHLLRERPSVLWLNLEAAKVVDPVGLAVVAQAAERATACGSRCLVFPSAVVFRGLFQAGLLDQVPVDKRRAWERDPADVIAEIDDDPRASARPLTGGGVRLARPAWDDLRLLESWARDPDLSAKVGSPLLDHCRHFGPHDPEFVAGCFGSATSLLLLVHPLAAGAPAVGFVRLFGVNLGQRFGFLETVIAPTRRRRTAWGIEASRLVLQYAVEAVGLHRVETKVYADNVLCVNALRRHGFTLEGTLREARAHAGRRSDILVFGMLAPQIRAGLAGAIADMTPWPHEPA
jgi:RimJ/RimL family protein N-acetyltransferase